MCGCCRVFVIAAQVPYLTTDHWTGDVDGCGNGSPDGGGYIDPLQGAALSGKGHSPLPAPPWGGAWKPPPEGDREPIMPLPMGEVAAHSG